MAAHIAERLQAPGPKRMLALDGGGTRGIITIAFLAEIERTLQKKLGRGDDFVLADYFDLIGGTSVGSIIATLLALGWRVSEIQKEFTRGANAIFRPRRSLLMPWKALGLLRNRHRAHALREFVERIVRKEELRSDKLKTGLCIIAKRVDTGSVWVMVNNPLAKYFQRQPGSRNVPNGEFLLADLIRASTAAPTYFRPKSIGIYKGPRVTHETDDDAWFVDGGVSPHNNPALQMLMLAGMQGYNLGGSGRPWPLGKDKLFLLSVGTGSFSQNVLPTFVNRWIPGFAATEALKGVISDGQELGLALLQWMSQPPGVNWKIDSEIGTLAGELIGHPGVVREPVLSFQRYDVRLEKKWLAENLGRSFDSGQLQRLQDFTTAGSLGDLLDVGSRAAHLQVSKTHFPNAFDQVWKPLVREPVWT